MIKLFDYQEQAIQYLENNEQTHLLFMNCGSGKTITTLTYIKRHNLNALILVPPKIKKAKVWELENKDINAHITTVSLYFNQLDYSSYDTLVIDEAHRIKGVSKINAKVYKMCSSFDNIIGLTGTYAPNSYLDTFRIAKCLHSDMFKNMNEKMFIREFYYTYVYKNVELLGNLRKQKIDILLNEIKKHSYIYTLDYQDIYNGNKILYIDYIKGTHYQEVVNGYLNNKELTDFTKINHLRMITNGYYHDIDKDTYINLDTQKRDYLRQFLTNLDENKTIIVYTYIQDKKYLEKNTNCYLIQEQTGEGLNLQEYNNVIFYNPTYSQLNYTQCLHRIVRKGQSKMCNIYVLICKGTIEELIYKRLNKKISDARLLLEME
jgi:superfamily II DNA or RNA helicase